MRRVLVRLCTTLLVLWGTCTITFFLLHLTPGDPVELMLTDSANSADKLAMRHALGLDESLLSQYGDFFKHLGRGSLGSSFVTHRDVVLSLAESLPATIELAVGALAMAFVFGISAGVLAAVRKDGFLDRVLYGYSLVGMSTPSFWLAPALIWFFSIELDWFPVSGREDLSSLFLPALSLAFGLGAAVFRMTRAAMLESLREPFIQAARARGLSENKIIFKHALKYSLTPIITIMSLQAGAVLTGVVVTETLFDWPGVGILLFNALQRRDYPVVQGTVLLIAIIFVLTNLVADLIYPLANPELVL